MIRGSHGEGGTVNLRELRRPVKEASEKVRPEGGIGTKCRSENGVADRGNRQKPREERNPDAHGSL